MTLSSSLCIYIMTSSLDPFVDVLVRRSQHDPLPSLFLFSFPQRSKAFALWRAEKHLNSVASAAFPHNSVRS